MLVDSSVMIVWMFYEVLWVVLLSCLDVLCGFLRVIYEVAGILIA